MVKIMKRTKLISFIIIFIFFLAFPIQLGIAANSEDYVGIKENNEFVWTNEYDTEVWNTFVNDFNLNYGSLDEDLIAIKIVVDDVEDDEDSFYGYDGVEVEFTTYDKYKGENEWVLDSSYDYSVIFDFDDEFYALMVWIMREGYYPFLSTKIDWEDLADELRDLDDYFNDLDDVDVEVDDNGLTAVFEWSKFVWGDIEDEDEVKIQYSNKGVLQHYERNYGGGLMWKMELRQAISGYPVLILSILMGLFLIGLIAVYRKKIE